jgi:daunorubicin resistance ABC transporter ATP-binding subunit
MSIIETRQLTKKYDKLIAVDNLNLNIEEGEIFGLLGPNGAGKTTTLMMLTTLIKPSSGRGVVNGYDIVMQPDKVRKSIGIVFQDPSSDDILTGYENLKLHGMLYSMPAALREEKIREVLKLVDLTERQHDLVRKYSGGMRRRLELARGLMHQPKIIFLDEPTLGLDPQTRETIWGYIENLSRIEKVTIIITTHYMEEADRLCSRLAIIDTGKIVALDSPSNLKKTIGGDIVTLKISSPDIESIKKLDFIKEIEISENIVFLTVTNANENLPLILRTIGTVESVEVHSPTLNDVFLNFTGRIMREDSPEGSWAERSMHYRAKK